MKNSTTIFDPFDLLGQGTKSNRNFKKNIKPKKETFIYSVLRKLKTFFFNKKKDNDGILKKSRGRDKWDSL